MKLKSFFAELKRRNVYKVAIAYGVRGTRTANWKSVLPDGKFLINGNVAVSMDRQD
jgi:hypothetical protein